MTDLFFYGTLRYAPLLECVLGRPLGDLDVVEASLPDYAVHAVRDQPFPTLVAEPGGAAQGIVVRALGQEDLDRLAFYKGGFDYVLATRQVVTPEGKSSPAEVFFPAPGLWAPVAPWSLATWVDAWGALSLCAAEEVMAYFGRADSQHIARNFPAIRTRAWARLAARQRHTGDPQDAARDVIVHKHSRAYINYFAMEEIDVQHRRFDGTMGPTLSRSGLMQGSAVIVLPYDPVRDAVLLVEQFRAPVFLIDDPEPWMWEPVAGMIDPGETPEQAAYRESMEEAHISLNTLEYAGGAYSSSGSSTEFVHLFVGLAALTQTTEQGGVASEGEDIRSKILSFAEFIDLVDRHVYKDLPLLTLAHWLARHRERLRA